MKQVHKVLLALILIAVLPFSLILAAVSLPDFYSEAYYAQLPALYHRLYAAEGKKLVIIGGSNVAFGLDTTLLGNILAQRGYDYTVCPFGLYAAVGTSAMLDLAEDALSEGDIVVLAIEPTSETFSTYFGATAFWKCCESTPQMLLHLSKDKQNALAGNYIPYLQERFTLLFSGDAPSAEGVYTKASFDDTGNMVYERAGNAMTLGYDTATPVDFASIVIAPDFAEQIRDFCALAQRKGASVYLSFSPVNRSAIADEAALPGFFQLCNERFPCSVISDPNDYIWDSGWFYDNNFHLNTSGAVLRTCQLAEDLLAQLGCYQTLEYDLPEMPASIAQIKDNAGNAEHFLFEAMGEGYLVAGLTEQGTHQTALTIPSIYDGKPVVGFTKDALTLAAQLQELTIPASIESLPDGLFGNCTALERLILEHTQRVCSISGDTFRGADNVRIFVPSESYDLYRDGDGCEANPWSSYLERIYVYG